MASSDEKLDEMERLLLDQLAYHRQAYQRAIEPIVQRLADLRNLRPHRFFVPLQDAIAAGLIPPDQP
jgi:hypothetical protein